jgi:hypothetical protein
MEGEAGFLHTDPNGTWTGVGAGRFGEIFERDYQLPEHKATYTTAINDFLTLGAERGIVPPDPPHLSIFGNRGRGPLDRLVAPLAILHWS